MKAACGITCYALIYFDIPYPADGLLADRVRTGDLFEPGFLLFESDESGVAEFYTGRTHLVMVAGPVHALSPQSQYFSPNFIFN